MLPPSELQALLASAHRPNYCLQELSEAVKQAQLPAPACNSGPAPSPVPAGAAYRMDEQLTAFQVGARGPRAWLGGWAGWVCLLRLRYSQLQRRLPRA